MLRGSRRWDAAEPAGIAWNAHPHLRQPLPVLRETPLPPLGTDARPSGGGASSPGPGSRPALPGARFIKSVAPRPRRGRGQPPEQGRGSAAGRTGPTSGLCRVTAAWCLPEHRRSLAPAALLCPRLLWFPRQRLPRELSLRLA